MYNLEPHDSDISSGCRPQEKLHLIAILIAGAVDKQLLKTIVPSQNNLYGENFYQSFSCHNNSG